MTLPSVILTATATATSTALQTTGSAHAKCGSYGVSLIEIQRDGQSLAGDNYKALPGQHINLTVDGASSDTYEWQAPEKTFYYYDETLASNQLHEELETDLSDFHFYWTEGKDDERTVTCDIVVDGQTVTIEGVIKVFKPISTFVGKGGSVQGVGLGVVLGEIYPAFPHGMAWDTTSVSVPFSSGVYGFFQIGDVSRSGSFTDENSFTFNWRLPAANSHGLDGGAPYSGFTRTTSQVVGRPLDGNGRPFEGTTAGDSPGDGLYVRYPPLDLDTISISDSYTTWLMFKPDGADSCYVPLKKFTWSWGATEIRQGSSFVGLVTSSTAPGDKTGTDTTDFPLWSSVISPTATWEEY